MTLQFGLDDPVVVRRLSRQVARLTRLQTGYLDSADVGQDAT